MDAEHMRGASAMSESQEAIVPPTPGDLVVFDLRTLAKFQESGPGVTVLSDTGAARTVLFAFRAEQQLKEHRTSSQILVQVLRGRITFTAPASRVTARAGTLLQLEADIPHSIEALTDAVVLLTLTPSPAQHSLERELFTGKQPLVSRV
jgi:quercetin dioxygenase-like cupin family protein